MRRFFRQVLLLGIAPAVLAIGNGWAATARAEGEGNAVAAALAAAPPTAPITEARQQALRKLDGWIARPSSDQEKALIEYYRAAVDRALDTLAKEKVVSGIRIFQLYSSSVIVQTPETVFAIDLDQGPNKNISQTPAKEGTAFCMTDAQIAKLAANVQYSFHTHEHSDHVDYQITRALLDAGKTVIVTQSNKEMWKKEPWVEKLVVLDQTLDSPTKVGPLKVCVLHDFQWSNSDHTRGTPCNALVVETPGGLNVMTKGDINCGLQLYGWLSLLAKRGVKVDVVVGSTIFWRGVNVLPEWDALLTPLWLPGHLWEFEHRSDDEPKGNCAAYTEGWRFVRNASASANVEVLSWGEWIDIAPKEAAGK